MVIVSTPKAAGDAVVDEALPRGEAGAPGSDTAPMQPPIGGASGAATAAEGASWSDLTGPVGGDLVDAMNGAIPASSGPQWAEGLEGTVPQLSALSMAATVPGVEHRPRELLPPLGRAGGRTH